jgi:phosphoribosylformimino-5-aminoimidazole carboxamide ribotide isomerase
VLSSDPTPTAIGAAFKQLGFDECYVADLDAIAGAEPVWSIYDQLGQRGLALWIDAGLTDVVRAEEMVTFGAGGVPMAGIVAGLESLSGPALLGELLRIVGPERLVFSLDLKHGRPLTGAIVWRERCALDIAFDAIALAVRRLIVLDLSSVGMREGLRVLPLCRQLRDAFPELEITSGGGVRNFDDLTALRQAGCDAALVASALHDGRLGRDEIARLNADGRGDCR